MAAVVARIYIENNTIEKFEEELNTPKSDKPTSNESDESLEENKAEGEPEKQESDVAVEPEKTSESEDDASDKVASDPKIMKIVDPPKESFKETFVKEFGRDLVFYISTFESSQYDTEQNVMRNQVKINDISDDENVLRINANSKNNISQSEGLLINNKKSMDTIYPRQLKFNTSQFTIFWYGKFIPVKYDQDVSKPNVYLVNIPVHNGQNLVGIEFEFSSEYTNPTIKIHWMGEELSEKYSFESISSDKDKSLDFFDNKYHLFTFIKSSDGTFKLILDDQTLTSSPLLSGKIDGESVAVNDKNSYRITLNSSVSDPTPSDDNEMGGAPNVPLNMFLNSFGIYNRSLEMQEINDMYKYFNDIKFLMDPRYAKVKAEVNKFKEYTACPFSDKTLCDTPNCSSVSDWLDNSKIVNNEKCYKDVMRYCDSLDSFSSDKICTFFSKDNVLKSASMVNQETVAKVSEDNDKMDEEEIVKQLRKIGLNNIHLDKSLRADGKYSKEVNDLIDQIFEQKQMNLKGLKNLKEADDGDMGVSPLSYDSLSTNKNTDKLTEEAVKALKIKEMKDEQKRSSDIIDLKYADLDGYDEMIKEFEKEESKKPTENGGFLKGWF
tara:strand:- start:1264 stop:3087 length:1824 start_codon:yes stop_codon:yes gene_type:complete